MLAIAFLLALNGGDVEFARDVRPILERNCFRCHGPKKDKADLRLDVRSRALAGAWGGTEPVIVAGKASESSLYLRLVSNDEEERMPYEEEPLASDEIETIRTWLDEGAKWPDEVAGEDAKGRGHWAYEPLARPALPDGFTELHPIDAFVEDRLARERIAPAPLADRATLLRRLSLDLIGLPPTLEDLNEFELDESSGAYERAVDRLLASPHFGERMARPWLDLARYADTQGYEKDARRSMSRYRDWVIDAFNANVPFDRFTIEQLAGDLLPDATLEQRLATAFHRNTMLNEEGGTDAEEFRVDAVIDRVNTTATIWLGSTLACAQCHDHKYDPFTQRDYYRLFAAFNSTADSGRESAPVLEVPRPEEQRELERLDARIAEIERKLAADDDELDAEQREWEAQRGAEFAREIEWTVLEPTSARVFGATEWDGEILPDRSVAFRGPVEDRPVYEVDFQATLRYARLLRIEALLDGDPPRGPGRASHGNFVLSSIRLYQNPENTIGHRVPHVPERSEISLVAALGDVEQSNGPFRAADALDTLPDTGWAIGGSIGVPHEAVFSFPRQRYFSQRGFFRLRLEHSSKYAQHALARVRLSLSDDEVESDWLLGPRFENWYVLGPLPAASFEAARDTSFAPEREPAVAVERTLIDEQSSQSWALLRVGPNVHRHDLTGDRSAWYFAREFESERDEWLELFIGADDFVRVWLDGRVVHESSDYRTLTENPARVEVRVARGSHRLLFKVVNGSGPGGFSFDVGHNTRDRVTPEIKAILRTPQAARIAEQTSKLRDWYRRGLSQRGAQLSDEMDAARKRRGEIASSVPTVLVMRELDTPRESHVFQRGSFLTPGERVEPGVPERFGGTALDPHTARLELARWLVGPQNPLAARAWVNRTWEMLFGRALAATVADLGTRGEPPTHPELLDWLASEFVESGWDVKHLLRTIVTSDAYQRSSDAPAEDYARDPDNALLARGSRFRVEAEMLRDIALASSGLLAAEIGGPSVFPPQPPGTWNSAYSGDDWKEDPGEGRHRRGLYTFWKRTAPYVTFALFEAPSREVACTRRARTDTPLQALALLDDPAFVEAAVALARRMLDASERDSERIEFGYRVCTSHHVDAARLAVLERLLATSRETFARDPEAAKARAGDSEELAAWTSIASVLLNLDDTLVRR
jgi:hypothetical protein